MNCCRDCKLRYKIEKMDYSRGGCEHSDPGGFVCMAFEDEDVAAWMVGVNEREDLCEMFTPKEMTYGRALHILDTMHKSVYSEGEKTEALKRVTTNATRNAVTKQMLLNAIDWLTAEKRQRGDGN